MAKDTFLRGFRELLKTIYSIFLIFQEKMRHRITRLMMYNIVGLLKFFPEKNQKFYPNQSEKNFWEISKIFELDMISAAFRCVEHDALG